MPLAPSGMSAATITQAGAEGLSGQWHRLAHKEMAHRVCVFVCACVCVFVCLCVRVGEANSCMCACMQFPLVNRHFDAKMQFPATTSQCC